MDKTAITVAFIALAALGVAGVVAVILLRPDAVGSMVSLLVTVLGIATSAVVTFYMLGKQGAVIETIKTQTNGNTTALLTELERVNSLLALSPAIPHDELNPTTSAIVLGKHAATPD